MMCWYCGLGSPLGRLEQALAVPLIVGDRRAGGQDHARQYPVGGEGDVTGVEVLLDRRLDLRIQAVVFGMEQFVDGGQADVLVHPAVTGDVVSVQQLVVVGQVGAGLRIEWLSVPRLRVGVSARAGRKRRDRCGVVRDVVEEGAADGDCRVVQPVECAVGGDRGGEIALQEALRHDVGGRVGEVDDELRQAIRAADEIAVRVGGQQRHRAHVGIGELDAEERRGVGLQVAPRRHGDLRVVGGAHDAVGAGGMMAQQRTGRMQLAVRADHVFAQEHLV